MNIITRLIDNKKDLRNALIAKADKVEDIKELRSINEQITLINAELKDLDALAAEQEEREAAIKEELKNKLTNEYKKNDESALQMRSLAKVLMNRSLNEEEKRAASSVVNAAGNGGLIPEQFVNQIDILRKGFPSLKPYCHVIPVTSDHGKMPAATLGQNKLVKLTGGPLPEGAFTSDKYTFNVADYGKFVAVENSLTEDEVIGIITNLLFPDFAEGSVNIENEEIITVLKAGATAVTGAKTYEDIQVTIDTTLPAARNGLTVVTNISGYAYLKNLKDKEGRPLDLITNIGGVDYFHGYPLVYLDDADVAPATAGNMIYYVCNLREGAKFFDRKGIELATSKEALFTSNQTAVRAIERFEVVKGSVRSFKSIEFAKPTA